MDKIYESVCGRVGHGYVGESTGHYGERVEPNTSNNIHTQNRMTRVMMMMMMMDPYICIVLKGRIPGLNGLATGQPVSDTS